MARSLSLAFLLAPALAGAGAAQSPGFGEVHRMIPAYDDASRHAALGDVDGDGDLDAFVAVSGAANRLYRNDGFGTLRERSGDLPADADDSLAVALGDVDGDGDLDAVVGNSFGCIGCPGGANRLLLNDGTGAFADGDFPAHQERTWDVALGDVDADGDLDLLVGNARVYDPWFGYFGGGNQLYRNDGAGGFVVDGTALESYTADTVAVALEDLDGDGDLDAFFVSTNQPYAAKQRMSLNDGAGHFADASAGLPLEPKTSYDVVFADVDGDGDRDAFLSAGKLWVNLGSGVFADASFQLPPLPLTPGRAVAAEDVDLDGDADLVLVRDGQDQLLRNDGGGFFADATADLPALAADTRAAVLGDLDGDGDPDLLSVNALVPSEIALNDGAGRFANPAFHAIHAVDSAHGIAVGDLDGDEDLDVILANRFHPNRMLVNDGSGMLSDGGVKLPDDGDETWAVALGDVDGDGDLDALFANSGQDRLYRNVAGALVYAPASLPVDTDPTAAVALGDVDGDGDLDALFGNFGTVQPQNKLYRNDGTGTFVADPGSLPVDPNETSAIVLLDADADGDLDAAIGNGLSTFSPGRILLYVNDGTGAFVIGVGQTPADLAATRGLAAGDLDGDGTIDLFAARGGGDRVLLNDGTGAFAYGGSLPSTTGETTTCALGDADGDGDLDVALGRVTAPDGLLLNDGAASFQVGPTVPGVLDTRSVALADLDGDGDKDLLIGRIGGSASHLHHNLTRHLAWRGVPRAGKPLVLEIHGEPGAPWFLAWSPGTAYLHVFPFGVLKLDPGALFAAGSGALDAAGFHGFELLVPTTPGLVGTTVYWQALVSLPLRFTNLERTTVTGL